MSRLSGRDMSRHLEDPIIQDTLAKVDDAVILYNAARSRGDYSEISLTLGMFVGAAHVIYARNAQIDLEALKRSGTQPGEASSSSDE